MIGARLSVFRAERFRGPRAAGTRASVDRPVDYPADDLTPAERERIAPHFTDLDGPVFALVNLPETVKGALLALSGDAAAPVPGRVRRLAARGRRLRRRRGPPRGGALRAHLRRLRGRLGGAARRRARRVRVDLEHPHEDPAAPSPRRL